VAKGKEKKKGVHTSCPALEGGNALRRREEPPEVNFEGKLAGLQSKGRGRQQDLRGKIPIKN